MAQPVLREESMCFWWGDRLSLQKVLHHPSARLLSSCYPLRAVAKGGGWLSPCQSVVNKQEQLTVLGQVDLGSVRGREEIPKVNWKKRLGLS